MERKFLVDGHETTLRELLHTNTEQEGMINVEDIRFLLGMRIGEVVHMGKVDIRRIS